MKDKDLFDKIPELIGKMDVEFLAHSFILKLAQANQPEYVQALLHYKSSFRTLHSRLSLAIGETGLVANIGTFPSVNIWQEPGECVKWKKITKTT